MNQPKSDADLLRWRCAGTHAIMKAKKTYSLSRVEIEPILDSAGVKMPFNLYLVLYGSPTEVGEFIDAVTTLSAPSNDQWSWANLTCDDGTRIDLISFSTRPGTTVAAWYMEIEPFSELALSIGHIVLVDSAQPDSFREERRQVSILPVPQSRIIAARLTKGWTEADLQEVFGDSTPLSAYDPVHDPASAREIVYKLAEMMYDDV